MSNLKTLNSGKGFCPVCAADRKNSNKCKQDRDTGLIQCYRGHGANHQVGDELNGFRFLGDADGWGLWKPATQWTGEPPATVTKRPRQEEQRTEHIALEKLDLRLGDPIDTSTCVRNLPTAGSYEFVYNDGRGVTRDASKNFPCWVESSWDRREYIEGDPMEWHFFAQDVIQPGGTLLLVEGEQTALGALGVGFQAVASPHGHGCKDVDFLQHRLSNGIKCHYDGVAYLADNDEAGLVRAEKMRQAAAAAGVPFVIINASEIPELVDIKGGSIDDLTCKLDGSGMGLSGEEVLGRLEAAFEASVVAQMATQRRFTDDIDALLDLELAERINDAIPLRKDIKKVYGVQDSRIAKELLYAIQRRFAPTTTKPEKVKRRRSTRRSTTQRTIYLHDGLTPAAAVCQTDGPSDAGKLSFEIEKCIAVVEGRGCFDRDHPTKQGSVLFIATDSGGNDFYATLDRLGYSDHPSILQGELEPDEEGYVEGAPAFFIWAENPEDGIKAWTATPANIARLIEFCRENNVLYVVMDSVKTIMGEGVSYTDNTVVAQFVVMLKSTVCLATGTTVCLINHDGVIAGDSAGAKAWKENVTMRTRLEPAIREADNTRLGSKALIVKDRIGGQNRSFGYRFAADAAFELMDGADWSAAVTRNRIHPLGSHLKEEIS